jgi:hypothetical protein
MLRNRFPESPPASREGMAEMFTLQRLKLPPSLYKCLATTSPIESPQSGVARRTANVKSGVIREWSGVGLPRPGYSPKKFPKSLRPS